MDNLTALQLATLNNVSRQRDSSVYMGTILDGVIDHLAETGTAVNAVNATGTLTISGVVLDGQTVTINNPAVAGSDVYEFLADEAQSKTATANIAVDITDYATKASGVLTLAAQPTSGDTMTIGSKVYTFVPVGTDTADGEVSIGADLAAAKIHVVEAINGTDGINTAHPLVSASDFALNDCTITAFVGGVAGNAIATTETFTNVGNVFGAVTLESGTDCTAANAVTALAAAVTASDTQGVGAADGAGDTVVFTADTAGVAGNSITTVESMANGSFGAGTLASGVNGTVGNAGKLLVDATYLYVAIANNLVSGKNWRRISVGSAF